MLSIINTKQIAIVFQEDIGSKKKCKYLELNLQQFYVFFIENKFVELQGPLVFFEIAKFNHPCESPSMDYNASKNLVLSIELICKDM